MDRRLPRAADLLAARPPPSARPARRVRRRPRQPDPRLRAARRPRRARWSPPSTTPSPSTGSWSWTPPQGWQRRASVRRWYALHPDAEAGRAPAAVRAHRLRHLPAGDRRPPRAYATTASTSCTSAPTPTSSRPTRPCAEVPGRIVTTSSADVPLKGLVHLVEALAKLRTEHPAAHLVVVGKRAEDGPGRPGHRAVRARRRRRVRQGHLATPSSSTSCARAEVACVPSLYEGFSLPAAEAMATGTPLVATTGGAIPEVAGPDGETCLAVPPGRRGRAGRRAGPAAGRPGAARAGSAPPGASGCWPASPGPGPPRARPRTTARRSPSAAGRGSAVPRRPTSTAAAGRAVDAAAERHRRRTTVPPTAKAGPRADRRLLPVPARPGRPRPGPRLRRRPARLRVLPARRPGRGPRPERRGDPRGRQVVRRDEGGRGGARRAPPPPPWRATPSRCPSPTSPSTS